MGDTKRAIFRAAPVCAAITLISGYALAGAEDAFGTWRDAEKGSVVEVYKCGEGLCAQIVKSKDGGKDVNNTDAALRSRSVNGLVIMSGAKKNGANAWKGRIYNREDGGTYSGALTVVSKSQLQLEGCGLGGLVCKSRLWSRID